MDNTARISMIAAVTLLLLSLFPAGALAHRLIMQQEGDTLFVRYDDSTAASRATIQLFNEAKVVIWEGKVDSEGRVQIPVRHFARAVADDGLGHKTTYIPGQISRELPRPLAAALGVALLLFVAAVSHYFTQKNKAT
jgi:hypothetical protein